MLAPLGPGCRRIVIEAPLADPEYSRIAALMKAHGVSDLMVHSHARFRNLAFLEHFPFLKSFFAECFPIGSLEGVEALPESLKELTLGRTKKKFSLAFLERFRCLETLSLEAHSQDFEAISSLSTLRNLTLRSFSLPDLSALVPLKNLDRLDIKLGGTRNLEHLPEIGRLRYVELWMIRGLSDLRPVGGVVTLQWLFLESLKNVRRLPPLGLLKALRRVELWTMKGLRDLRPLLGAPALEELVVIGAAHLRPSDFVLLRGHPPLKRATITLDSLRKNEEVKALLGLPGVGQVKGGFEFR